MTKRLTGKDDRRLTWQVAALAEDSQIEGNCSAIDPETDRETEDMIRAQLERGNEWAWCCACVSVSIDIDGETYEGRDHLGCSSYESETQFRADGYYEDMRDRALEDLCKTMDRAVTRGELAKGILWRAVSVNS